ncbi:MAG: hypothetical protein JW958_12595 [Candidatus Eisenbacteria bacterium]|nr:hypothetical protein [Candidatus Eisenbacteria bacterium]
MIDERFLMHRLKSTSLAAVVGGVGMGGWALYNLYGRHVMRWDLMIILLAMAIVKIGALLYYRRNN